MNRSWIGWFMYNITDLICKKIMKHRWLIYLLNYTWGIITTLIGWLIYIFCLLFLKKYITEKGKFMHCHYIRIFNHWGGWEMGINFLCDTSSSELIKYHECGHTIQNALYGPLFIIIIWIPSAIRYWFREFQIRKGKKLKEYDAIWFEGSASDLGKYYYDNFKKYYLK